MTYDLIVVGDGLAARVFLYRFSGFIRQYNSQIPSVLVISDAQTYTPCSLKTTATISKVGMQPGVGEHGDLLLRAYDEFESFARELPAKIVTCAAHYQVFMGNMDKDEERFCRRYGTPSEISPGLRAVKGESYLADPVAMMNYLKSGSEVTYVNDSVLALDHSGVVMTLNGRYQAKHVLVAAGGAGEELLADSRNLGNSPSVGESVFGSYLEWEGTNPLPNLGESWQVALSKFNVLYRHLDQKLLLGGTTTKNIHCFHPVEMKEQYELAQEVLEGRLPCLNAAKHLVGERSKLAARRPFWGRVAGRIWAIRGLYKNGFTLAFLAARELLEDKEGLGSLV